MLEQHFFHIISWSKFCNLYISSFLEVLYKKRYSEKLPKFTDKHKKLSSGGVLSKDILLNFAKFPEKCLLIKLQAGNLKLPEASTGDIQLNKVLLKNSQISRESLVNKVAVLRTCSFIKDSDFIKDFPLKFGNFLRTVF